MIGCRVADTPAAPASPQPWSTLLARESKHHTILVVAPDQAISHSTWQQLCAGLPQGEQDRIKGLLRRSDQLNSAVGWNLMDGMAQRHGLRVQRSDQGRPSLAPPLDVSLSHSDRWTAVALSRSGRIGIDIEAVRSVSSALHRRCLTAYEMGWLADAPPGAQRDRRFFRVWTAKEAYLKALGVGLSLDPRDVEMDCSGQQTVLRGDVLGWRFTTDALTLGLRVTMCAEVVAS